MLNRNAIAVFLTAGLAAAGWGVFAWAGGPGESVPVIGGTRGSIDYLRSIDSKQLQTFAKPRSLWGKVVEWVAGPGDRPWFGRPFGLAEDSEGRLIVTDPDRGVVHVLDFERRKYEQLLGAQGNKFVSPVGVAVDTADNIYVSDSMRAAIFVFDKRGKFLRALDGPRGGPRFQRPTGLAIDSQGELIYVADTLRHHVLVLKFDGELVRVMGRRGIGPGEFNYPAAIALASGEIYVVDSMNFRIQVFNPEGHVLRNIGRVGDRTGALVRPKGIALDSDGHIYVTDALLEVVQIFDIDGNLLHHFGSSGNATAKFALPSGIYIGPRDRIYVADSQNQRVQVFRYKRVSP